MNIPAATLAQIHMTDDGRVVEIDPAVSHVAKELDALEVPQVEGTTTTLRLRFSEAGEHFVVYQERVRSSDGKPIFKQLVTTWDATQGPIDSGLVERVRKVMDPNYDVAAEAERLDREAESAAWHRFDENVGVAAAPLLHGLRKDKLANDRIYVPRGL